MRRALRCTSTDARLLAAMRSGVAGCCAWARMTAGISKPMIMVSPKPGWIESADAARRRGPLFLAPDPLGRWGLMLLYGADGIRTHDPLVANQVLSQLSYRPANDLRHGVKGRCRRIVTPQRLRAALH